MKFDVKNKIHRGITTIIISMIIVFILFLIFSISTLLALITSFVVVYIGLHFLFEYIYNNIIDLYLRKDVIIKTLEDELNNLKNIQDDILGGKSYITNEIREAIHSKIYYYQELRDQIPFTSIFFGLKKKLENLDNKYNSYIDSIVDGIEQRNKKYIAEEIKQNENYLDTIEQYPLDILQKEAIVNPEKNHLIVAGAGSGKTTTIVGKAKYLLNTNKVRAEELLLISFTKKSATEMAERIEEKLGVNIDVMTFHKLGLTILDSYIKKNKKEKYTLYDENIIRDFKKEISSSLIERLTRDGGEKFFRFYNNILLPYKEAEEFESQGDYVDYMVNNGFVPLKDRVEQGKISLGGEVMKSMEEVEIANFLFLNGVEYKYEADYKFKTANVEYGQYRPDFFLPEHDIYIEHYGINKKGNVAKFFGDGAGGYSYANNKYKEGMQWKKELHEENDTKLLTTFSYEKHDGVLLENLTKKLEGEGVELKPLSNQEIEDKIIPIIKVEYDNFINMLFTFLELYKSSHSSIESIKQKADLLFESKKEILRAEVFIEIFEWMHDKYHEELEKRNAIDFNDMIYKATNIINNKELDVPYKYIIVDEFQDIGIGRYNLIKSISDQNNASLFAVGDDWQSIYRFSGSDLNVFTSFDEYFEYGNISFINKTYRYPQEVNELTKKFIMQNSAQIDKILVSGNKNDSKDVYEIIEYQDKVDQAEIVKGILTKLPEGSSVMLLGRTNNDNILKDFSIKYPNLVFNTVHKSKGLEADYVILLNGNSGTYGFPIEIQDDRLLNLVLSRSDDFPFSEERRLFYVALTRSKNKTFILYQYGKRSSFVEEFNKYLPIDIRSNNKSDEQELCPKCRKGFITHREKSKNGIYGCSRYPRCDYSFYKTVSFGKHQGKSYSKLPEDYKDWLLKGYSGKNRDLVKNSVFYVQKNR